VRTPLSNIEAANQIYVLNQVGAERESRIEADDLLQENIDDLSNDTYRRY